MFRRSRSGLILRISYTAFKAGSIQFLSKQKQIKQRGTLISKHESHSQYIFEASLIEVADLGNNIFSPMEQKYKRYIWCTYSDTRIIRLPHILAFNPPPPSPPHSSHVYPPSLLLLYSTLKYCGSQQA